MTSQETAERITTSLRTIQEMSEKFEVLQKQVAFLCDKLDELENEINQMKSRETQRLL